VKIRKPFQFKQFKIEQSLVTLPVTTDACIFGSFCTFNAPKNILDIGTGTGLLALMMHQKYPSAMITAVEKHPETAKQAQINCNINHISNIEILEADIFTFTPKIKFDAIISNPPFFANQLESETDLKNQARHFNENTFHDFFMCIGRLLNNEGNAWILLPFSALETIAKDLKSTNLYIQRLVSLKPNQSKKEHLLFLNLSFNDCILPKVESFWVKNSENKFSQEVYKWLEPFYLEQALNM
jgi:tRNA1Val (adenine37-N6)-methyltransferase